MTNYRVLFYAVLCVVLVSVYAQNNDELVRDKRTLNFILKAFADSLGYDVQKRPSILPTSGLPKPAAGPRTPVAPPLPPMAPAKPAAPAAPPMMPKAPPPPPMMPPMMPAAPPMMPKAPPAPPMMPPPASMPAAPAPMPPPKGQVGPVPPAKPRPPTAPPLLTETIQKMFNINFNWNRNVAPGVPAPAPAPKAPAPAPPGPPPKAPAPAPPAPAPAPKAPPPPPPPAPKAPPPPPAPAPKAPAPAPAPKAPAPAPKAPAPAPAPAPAVPPKGTVAPGKQIYINYDYDDGQTPIAGNLRTDYDGIYYYENDAIQPQQQEQKPQEQQLQQPQEEEVNQNEQNADQQDHEGDAEKKRYEFNESVQNFWQNSPWHQSNNERYNAESRPGFYQSSFGGHDFVINHPGGNSYSRMQHKKVEPVQRHEERYEYQGPQFGQYYFPESGLPQVGEQHGKGQDNYGYQGPSGQVQHGQDNGYQGPTFDQYYYILGRDEQPKVENGKESGKVEVNNNGEKGLKQPPVEAESRPKEVQAPEAGLPVPVHNIYQENQFVQWLSPFEQVGSENSPKKVLKVKAQKINKNIQRGGNPYQFDYEPEHYESDFSVHTIPPPTQQDYSQYEPAPFKLEDELPEKAQIKEQNYGRKYTTIHSDNTVHHIH